MLGVGFIAFDLYFGSGSLRWRTILIIYLAAYIGFLFLQYFLHLLLPSCERIRRQGRWINLTSKCQGKSGCSVIFIPVLGS